MGLASSLTPVRIAPHNSSLSKVVMIHDKFPADSFPEPPPVSTTTHTIPIPAYVVVGIGLLLGVVWLDIYRPFGLPWSNLYVLIAVYVGTVLRGRVEVILYCSILVVAMLVPTMLWPESIGLGVAFVNRVAGMVGGLIMIGLIWGRREFIESLRLANDRLEAMVRNRTSELQRINNSLQFEIAEHQRTQDELRSSRERLEILSRQLITTLEAERSHIALELHDEIGQSLTAIKMNLRRTQRMADVDIQPHLQENVDIIDQAICQVRNLSLSLRPPQLDDLGLVAAVNWLLRQQGRNGEFEGLLEIDLNDVELSSILETVCFRIVQEALTNVVRHARPTTVNVKLWHNNDQLCLCIQDDGIGFNVDEYRQRAQKGYSVGLISMSERASLIGGRLNIESTPHRGTTIHASFPLSATGL
jgi:signal transduction histidine kinase